MWPALSSCQHAGWRPDELPGVWICDGGAGISPPYFRLIQLGMLIVAAVIIAGGYAAGGWPAAVGLGLIAACVFGLLHLLM